MQDDSKRGDTALETVESNDGAESTTGGRRGKPSSGGNGKTGTGGFRDSKTDGQRAQYIRSSGAGLSMDNTTTAGSGRVASGASTNGWNSKHYHSYFLTFFLSIIHGVLRSG